MGGLASHCPGAGLSPTTPAGRRVQDTYELPVPARRPRAGLIPQATAATQVHDSCIRTRNIPRRSGFTLRQRDSKADAKAQSRIRERGAQGLKIGELWGSRGVIRVKPTSAAPKMERVRITSAAIGRKACNSSRALLIRFTNRLTGNGISCFRPSILYFSIRHLTTHLARMSPVNFTRIRGNSETASPPLQ